MPAHVRSAAVALLVLLVAAMPSANAIHFYRGCTPIDGAQTDQTATQGEVGAAVMLMHNTFNDTSNGSPVTRIQTGQSVVWTWNSAHCHSVGVATDAFKSGFWYPTTEPTSPHVVPGFFDYPVPETNPTLSFQHTFYTPGTYTYSCIHHAAIGMRGVVIVE